MSSSPSAMLPKVTWASPSPIRDRRLSTRNTPSREQSRPIKEPAIRARWIKP